jgi:hypothetical protein
MKKKFCEKNKLGLCKFSHDVPVSKDEQKCTVKNNYGNVCHSLFYGTKCDKLAIGKCKFNHEPELATTFRRQFFADKKNKVV